MKTDELIKGEIYFDITDKKTPLLFTGKIEKNVNHGWNTYGDYIHFEPVRTEINKNYYLPKVVVLFFSEEIGNTLIYKN